MARQLRIEYPGAFYHVFSRGNQKQPIFISDEDRHIFLKALKEACEKCGGIIHAYCLMHNHYHLILQTPRGNLSKFMHFLNTYYTLYFNNKHERCGHLFQGRYRSVLVDAVSYARELSRYIHLNPVRSKLAEIAEDYPWSSYRQYAGIASSEGWLETTFIMKLFSQSPGEARKRYVQFVAAGVGREAPAIIEATRKGILGSDEFVEKVKKEILRVEDQHDDRESPQLRRLRDKPDLVLIQSAARRILGENNKLVRPVAIMVIHKTSTMKLKEIAKFFSLSVSGVSSACQRVRRAVVGNTALENAIREIEREIG